MDYEYEYDEMDGDEYQNLYQQEHAQPAAPQEDARVRRPSRLRERAPLGTEVGVMGASPMGNVIGMPGVNGVSEVAVMEPRSFEEMPRSDFKHCANASRLFSTSPSWILIRSQRAVDFVAGGTYAIDGYQERIGESIFLFTPACQVSTQGVPGYEAPQPQQPQARPDPSGRSRSRLGK